MILASSPPAADGAIAAGQAMHGHEVRRLWWAP